MMAPTREIALQICEVTREIGKHSKISVHCFIGGTPVHQDIENLDGCQIAVGTPGAFKLSNIQF